jgi:hypothetical protein
VCCALMNYSLVYRHMEMVERIWCRVLFNAYHFSRLFSGCWMRMKSPVSVRTPSRTSTAWTCCKLSLDLRLWNCLLRGETWHCSYLNCGWWITESSTFSYYKASHIFVSCHVIFTQKSKLCWKWWFKKYVQIRSCFSDCDEFYLLGYKAI